MKSSDTKSKFNIGETVVSIMNRKLKLIISDYKDRIYYCVVPFEATNQVFIFFEKEIERTDALVFNLKRGERVLNMFGFIR